MPWLNTVRSFIPPSATGRWCLVAGSAGFLLLLGTLSSGSSSQPDGKSPGTSTRAAVTAGQVPVVIPHEQEKAASTDADIKPSKNLVGPKNAKTCFDLGVELADSNRTDEAIEQFNRAIGINPDCGDAYFHRAWAWERKNEVQRAIEDYGRAIELNPGVASAYNNRGRCLYVLGRHRQAMDDLNQAIRIDPKSGETFFWRGITRFMVGQIDGAIQDFTSTIRLPPNHHLPLHIPYAGRGDALIVQGRHREAIADFDRAIELSPVPNGQFHKLRGMSRWQVGEFARARQDFDRAVRIDPSQGPAIADFLAPAQRHPGGSSYVPNAGTNAATPANSQPDIIQRQQLQRQQWMQQGGAAQQWRQRKY